MGSFSISSQTCCVTREPNTEMSKRLQCLGHFGNLGTNDHSVPLQTCIVLHSHLELQRSELDEDLGSFVNSTNR